MKLLERNQMYDTRYSQSFNDFGSTKNKMLATTRNSFVSRTDNSKLPQLNRSFSYSNAKNAKQKINDLDERVQELNKRINELKLQTRVNNNIILVITKIYKFP